MFKILFFILFWELNCVSVDAQYNQPDYFVFINYATDPGILGFNGRLYRISGDTLTIMSLIRPKYAINSSVNKYDSSFYTLTIFEKSRIGDIISSMKDLRSVFNPCIIDGMRFCFSCGSATIRHTAWVSNAYDDKIFAIIDIINNHTPPEFSIRYDKEKLKAAAKECYEYFFEREFVPIK